MRHIWRLAALAARAGLVYLWGMEKQPHQPPSAPAATPAARPAIPTQPAGEIGGPKGLEPTRFGDWEQNGRCTDF